MCLFVFSFIIIIFWSFAYERSAKFLRCTIFCSISSLRGFSFEELVGSEGVQFFWGWGEGV